MSNDIASKLARIAALEASVSALEDTVRNAGSRLCSYSQQVQDLGADLIALHDARYHLSGDAEFDRNRSR